METPIYPVIGKIYGINGDSWSTPASTMESFWSALGAGANGLVLNLYMTKDQTLVCAPESNLKQSCGIDIEIAELTLDEVQSYDAGKTYRSTQLDISGQPTGERGNDTPWQGLEQKYPLKPRSHLTHPAFEKVLQTFGRRTAITVLLPNNNYKQESALIDSLLKILDRYGLQGRVSIIGNLQQLDQIRMQSKRATVILDASESPLTIDIIPQMAALNCKTLLATLEQLEQIPKEERKELFDKANDANIQWQMMLKEMPYAPSLHTIELLQSLTCKLQALLTQGVLPSVNALAPRSVIFEDNFAGQKLDSSCWAAGYSRINSETKISVNNQLIIDIAEGVEYSGGGAIALLPIHGDFDATVSFEVEKPNQATTFEMSAISIDPGYDRLGKQDLEPGDANLTFDVHGAPPYASSERDQNDGFRCGWNNSSNLTQIENITEERSNWYKIRSSWMKRYESANMYNKYGRDVGDGSAENPNGDLRLVRTGPIFNSYYRDKHNQEWVCCGSMLVQNMPDDIYIRLAAKHWGKLRPNPAPANTVKFRSFKIKQY